MKNKIYKDLLDKFANFKTIDEVRDYLNENINVDLLSTNYTVDNVDFNEYDFTWVKNIRHSYLHTMISYHPNILMEYLLSYCNTKKYKDLINEKLNYKVSDALSSIYISDVRSKIMRIDFRYAESSDKMLDITFLKNKESFFICIDTLMNEINVIIREKKLKFIETL